MSSTISPAATTADARRVSLLVGVLFGLTGLGSSSAAIALPVMASDFGVSTGVSAWAISLYALMLAVATAVYGRISDLVGVRLPLAVGVGLMTAGALAGALAPSFGSLLVARIVQGAGAAAVPTLGVAIISARYSGSDRGMALGRVAGFAAAVSCIGPLAGGVIEGLARLARGDRPADARCSASPAAVALGADRGQRRPAGPVRRGPRRGDRRRRGAARAVPLDRPDRGHRRRGAGRARRTGRRCLGTPSPERLPARRGDPQPRRRTQCARGRSRSRGLVRPADRRARRTGGRRLGALAGRRRAPAERRGRPDGSPLRRSAAHPGRPGPGARRWPAIDRGGVAAGCSAGRVRRLRLAAGRPPWSA